MLVMTRRISQLVGFFILVSVIYVLLSVGSYSTEDPTWNYYTNRDVTSFANYGGQVGAFVADWGLQLFGTTLFVLIGCAAVGAICLLRARVKLILVAAGQSLLLIGAVSILAHLHWLDDPFFQADLLAGGAGGQWLAELLLPYLTHLGTYAVAGLAVLWVLFSCAKQSVLSGFGRVMAFTRLEHERDDLEDMYLFDENSGPRYPVPGSRRRKGRVDPDDEHEVGTGRQLAKVRAPRPVAKEVERAASDASPVLSESPAPAVQTRPSFLAQHARKPRRHSDESANQPVPDEVPHEESRAEPPDVGHSTPGAGPAATDIRPRTPPKSRPSSNVPVVPSFRAKYVMDLQKSLRKPPPEIEGAPVDSEEQDFQTWDEEPSGSRQEEALGAELPNSNSGAAEGSTDPAHLSGEHETPVTKPRSWRAARAADDPPRIFEASSSDTTLEQASRVEASPPGPVVSEGQAADPHVDSAVASEKYGAQVPVLPPLSIRSATSAQHPQLPSLELLDTPLHTEEGQNAEELENRARFLEQKLREFGVEGEVVQVSPGPVITMYEFAPAAGVKVNKIANLQDDLALVMRALSVRIVAPVPGKAVVGIEVPNAKRETIALRSLVESGDFQRSSSKLSIVLGKDILGQPVFTDLALIPHLLVAGATGSGKSVGLNSVICSMLFRATPAEVKMIMIDPKMLEFSIYDGIPHLLVPVVTDAKKAAVALRRVVAEMERRYQLLAAMGVRSIAQYNQKIREDQPGTRTHLGGDAEEDTAPQEPLPYLVVIVDELSDLMMVSSREVEDSLMRIAQMARAAGIHLIVATQRPSVDVLTGVIKANFPARLSFQVTSKTDSRTILDANGAETLLGRGDMLFLAPGTSKPQRVHGAYVSEDEITRLVEAWKEIEQPAYNDSFLEPIGEQVDDEDSEYDEKYDEAVALVARTGQASISMLQRRLRVGYNRAARMIEVMEKEGVVGQADGVKPREVLIRNTYDDV